MPFHRRLALLHAVPLPRPARVYLLTVLGAIVFDYLVFHVPVSFRLAVTLWMLLPVVIAAYVGGLWPGLLAGGIGMLSFELYTNVSYPETSLLERWTVYGLLVLSISILNELLHHARRRIEASELLHAVTLSSIGDAVITTDRQGRITFINGTAARLCGWSEQEAQGRDVAEVFPLLTQAAQSAPTHAQAMLEGITATVPRHHYLRTRTDQRIPVEGTASPIRLQNGEIRGVVMILRDCTERMQAEAVLRERLALQQQLATIASVLPGALHSLRAGADGSMRLEYASRSFEEMWGRGVEELRADASLLEDIIHPDDREMVMQATRQSAISLEISHLEFRVIHPQRGLRWVALDVAPRREGDDVVLYSILFDVTERKLVDERLRASQLQLRAALDAGEMGILQIDLSNRAVECDPRARQLLQWPEGSSPSLDALLTRVHAESRQEIESRFREALHAEGAFRAEVRMLPDTPLHWLGLTGRIEFNDHGRPQRLVAVLSDITSRRHAEESRLRSQKLEALGVLAGGIAHDFNNLLLVISGNVRLLKHDLSANDTAQNGLEEIDKASARATSLVRQILTVSHPQDQKQDLLALAPLIREVLSFARAILPTTIALQAQLDESVPAVTADAGHVHQALLNLLTNAADAVPAQGGCITVTLSRVELAAHRVTRSVDLPAGSYVRIVVADNGAGMDAETQQRIFDPFFTTKPQGKGTGLGLAIVHSVMKGIGGAVTVSSTPGAGSTFELYFRAAAGVPEATPAAPLPEVSRTARVLYIDDEESLVFLMTRTLQRMGHHVEGHVHPAQAIAAFRAHPDDYDVVVTDMSMPGMSGFEVAEAVLALRPRLPVIVTSGYLRVEDHEHARQLGVRELILKPSTIDELGQALMRCLE